MSKTIHIVCLDAPSPPDYGGAIDMYHKIEAFHRSGYKIRLHYFDYKPGRSTEGLEDCCQSVHVYRRKSFLQSLPLRKPFIVQSRMSRQLVGRLNEDSHPVLLEGLHCAGILPLLNKNKRVVLRMHNDEAAYYHHLAQTEKSFVRKQYFNHESLLLALYQKYMNKEVMLACLSQTDITVFKETYHFQNTCFIPCFIPWQDVKGKEGRGSFCLYHGNLSVPENEEAAAWLIREVFSCLQVPLVIAGKGISVRLTEAGKKYPHVRFVNNPSMTEIHELVREAHINVLPSLNITGVKLKLLNALLNGRFCITNKEGVMGSRIDKGLAVFQDAAIWVDTIPILMEHTFTSDHRAEREPILELYNNLANVAKLNALW